MVDINTWHKLTPAGQEEFRSYEKKLVEAVIADPNIYDGMSMAYSHKVYQDSDHFFFIAEFETDPPLGGIKSKNQAVIEALLTEAVQNYGR